MDDLCVRAMNANKTHAMSSQFDENVAVVAVYRNGDFEAFMMSILSVIENKLFNES